MRLYKVVSPAGVFEDGKAPRIESAGGTKWAGSQADARAARIAFEAQFKLLKVFARPEVTVTEVDVPTDKAGLIAFLNGL